MVRVMHRSGTRLSPNHLEILQTLNDNGFAAYLVGGTVRDLFLKRTSKDTDINTCATPEQVKGMFPNAEFVGAHFGVSLVKMADGEVVEVATFRTDGVYHDARHPESVKYTNDVREDLARRDFTMNALLMDSAGRLIDHVGGLDDIEKHVIRTVGNPAGRFAEDALRMMRAVRFACQLGFSIEPETMSGIRANAAKIGAISAERVGEELSKILVSGRAALGIELLDASGLLAQILPEVDRLHNCPQNSKHHPEGDVFVHTLGLLRNLAKGCSLTLALGALLHDIAKPDVLGFSHGVPTAHGHEVAGVPVAEKILRRLKYPADVINTVCEHVARHMTFRLLPEMRKAKQLRFIGQPNFPELLELHRLDCLSGRGNLNNHEYALNLAHSTPAEVVHPVRLITGNDLIELGLKPGPKFKDILEEIESLQMEGTINTKEEAVAAALRAAAF